MLVFLWDLPAFLFYLNLQEILGYLSYQLMFTLGESIIISLCITIVTALLPIKRIKGNLSTAGGLLAFSFAVINIIFKNLGEIAAWARPLLFNSASGAVLAAIGIWIFTVAALPILSIMLADKPSVTRRVKGFINSLYPLIGLYLFASAAGIIVVIVRNMQ
ncbi:MAG: hypothetical protein Fur002_05050 [Anaerolineales bacterium]